MTKVEFLRENSELGLSPWLRLSLESIHPQHTLRSPQGLPLTRLQIIISISYQYRRHKQLKDQLKYLHHSVHRYSWESVLKIEQNELKNKSKESKIWMKGSWAHSQLLNARPVTPRMSESSKERLKTSSNKLSPQRQSARERKKPFPKCLRLKVKPFSTGSDKWMNFTEKNKS